MTDSDAGQQVAQTCILDRKETNQVRWTINADFCLGTFSKLLIWYWKGISMGELLWKTDIGIQESLDEWNLCGKDERGGMMRGRVLEICISIPLNFLLNTKQHVHSQAKKKNTYWCWTIPKAHMGLEDCKFWSVRHTKLDGTPGAFRKEPGKSTP